MMVLHNFRLEMNCEVKKRCNWQ